VAVWDFSGLFYPWRHAKGKKRKGDWEEEISLQSWVGPMDACQQHEAEVGSDGPFDGIALFSLAKVMV
jgi:hypothetical protein